MKKEKVKVSGIFHRVTRAPMGMYGLESITVEDGVVTESKVVDPNYPTITLAQFGKQAFVEAQEAYDKRSQEEYAKQENK